MRGSQVIRMTLRGDLVWRAATVTVALCGAMVLGAWGFHAYAAHDVPRLAAAAVLLAAVFGLAVSLWRTTPKLLSWDGACWHLGDAQGAAGAGPIAGSLEVCLDLDRWLLLRFVPDARKWLARSQWLPVGRGTCGVNWHELRCAIYSPRSMARGRAAHDQ
jgi:hypothetical protein